MPRQRPSARSRASFLASRRSVLTFSLAATATEAGLTTMLVIPAVVRTRCNTKPENPASYAEKMLAPGNHRGKLSARRAGSAGTVAVFTICRWQRQVTVYVSLWTSMQRRPVRRYKRCVALPWDVPFKRLMLGVLERIFSFSLAPVASPLALIQHSDFCP